MFAHLKGKGRILLDFIKDEEVEDNDAPVIAKEALRYLAECFGTPTDIAIPYKLIRGRQNYFHYSPSQQIFYLLLAKEVKQAAQYCAVISHLMYRRVTYCREGLHSIVLIDEALAHLASRWFLKQHGLEEYANIIANGLLLPSAEMSVQDALHIEKHDIFALSVSNNEVSAQFYDCVARTAMLFEGWIDKEKICQMVNAPSWDSWISQLDVFEAKRVKLYFGLPNAESEPLDQNTEKTYFTSASSLTFYKRPHTK